MKRLMTIAVAVLTVLCMTACGGNGGAKKSDSPSKVVEKAMTCAVNEDYEGMVKYFDGTADATDEEVKEAAQVLALLYALSGGLQSFEILGEEIEDDGMKAEVKLRLTNSKGSTTDSEAELVKTDAGWALLFD